MKDFKHIKKLKWLILLNQFACSTELPSIGVRTLPTKACESRDSLLLEFKLKEGSSPLLLRSFSDLPYENWEISPVKTPEMKDTVARCASLEVKSNFVIRSLTKSIFNTEITKLTEALFFTNCLFVFLKFRALVCSNIVRLFHELLNGYFKVLAFNTISRNLEIKL